MPDFEDTGAQRATINEDSTTYWLRREQAARKLAEQASEQSIARIHLAMAESYAACAKATQLLQREGDGRDKRFYSDRD